MTEENGEQGAGPGYLRRILQWVVAAPDNEVVTIVDRAVTVLSRVAMFLTAAIVLIIFYEVVMRYVFFSPTLWVNELSLWLGSMIFLIAGMYTMQRRGHIRVTAVYDIVPRRVQIAFDFVAMVVVAYAFLMIVAAWPIALDTLLRWERFGTYRNPPVPETVKPLVLFVTAVAAVQAVNNFIIDSLSRRTSGTKASFQPAPGISLGSLR